MDSRLLNLFHDDPFDSNYVKYENTTDFWSNNSDVMGLQLAETLHGILPIPPSEVNGLNQEHKENQSLMQNNSLIYNTLQYAEPHSSQTPGTIGIITMNSNALSSDSDNEELNNHAGHNPAEGRRINYDEQSQYSNETFRSRTESSSIGDYESHSSDYDEVERNRDFINGINISDVKDVMHTFSSKSRKCSKPRTISATTNFSDFDGLGLQIDPNSFDLADFITKDDNSSASLSLIEIADEIETQRVSERDSDAESDIIVDVETVEFDGEKEAFSPQNELDHIDIPDDMIYLDDINGDPSWDPNHRKKMESNTKSCKLSQSGKTGNQSKSLKRKHAIGKEKVLSSKLNTKSTLQIAKKLPLVHNKASATGKTTLRQSLSGKNGKSSKPLNNEPPKIVNLFPCENQAEHKPQQSKPNDSRPQFKDSPPGIKRKLNLEEYKKRRAQCNVVDDEGANCEHLTNEGKPPPVVSIDAMTSNKSLSHAKHSDEVASIVKTLKEQSNQKPPTDPITEAKNKVLRMQQIKKAQQLKIIESTVSAKVPRVTKLPPLKDIVKTTYCARSKNDVSPLNQYEEIIIVSVGCNTDISIPPKHNITVCPRSLLKSSVLLYNISNTVKAVQATEKIKITNNSLISSIRAVVNKTATFMVNGGKDISATPSKKEEDDSATEQQHGEDKVIMHLRKDRIRKRTVCIAIQTDLLAEFPPLPMALGSLNASSSRKSRGRKRRKSRRKYRNRSSSSSTHESHSSTRSYSDASSNRSHDRSDGINSCVSCHDHDYVKKDSGNSSRSSQRRRSDRSSSSSSDSEFDSCKRTHKSNYKRRQRSCSNSRSSSTSTSTYSEYSDRSRSKSGSSYNSKRRNVRGRYNNNNKNYVDRNVLQPAGEERRIVYVGRIEEITNRDILRRKFSTYGDIKRVSIHYKETGMKYGFITYERSEDAIAAIDNGIRNPEINMYDISFGGRRVFCRASYADLDNAGINTYQSYVYPQAAPLPKVEDSFEDLLLKVKAKLNANKPSNANGIGASKV